MSAKGNVNKKRPAKAYKLTDWEFLNVKSALQRSIAALRKTYQDQDQKPSVRAMCGAEADEMQETLDKLREQDGEKS